jgi:hypothetical protein
LNELIPIFSGCISPNRHDWEPALGSQPLGALRTSGAG